MSRRSRFCFPVVALLVVAIGVPPAFAALDRRTPSDLYKAYYLEHELDGYAAARTLYQEVLEGEPSEDVRSAAQAGANRCRDHLAAENFSALMPQDAVFYVELNRPGEIVEKFAGMLGLTGKSIQEVLAQRPSAESNLPFHIPKEIVISPAIFDALNGFGGAAAAVTDFDLEGGPPSGVLVIHHGDTDLLRGVLETAFQFSPITEKIRGMPTFGANVPEVGRLTGVLTEALFIVGTSRDLVDGAVSRLLDPDVSSLATREDLADAVEERTGSTLFAYADLQAVLKIVKANLSEHDLRDFATANTIADLDSLRWATFSAGIHEGTLGLQFSVRLADDHRSLAYNMLRLPPMSRGSLACVPPNAAAFFGLGLNPALAQVASDTARSGTQNAGITGFDIGREIFWNIREFSAFVVPGRMAKPTGNGGPPVIPNIGIVFAVNDAQKSEALWDQFLSLPGLVAGKEPVPPKKMEIGSTPVTAYMIPEFGRIYLSRLDNCIAIGASRTAIKASIRAHGSEKSVLTDAVMSDVIDRLPEDSSVMFVAHLGRLAKVAADSGDPIAAMIAGHAADLCSDTVTWFGLGQSPNQMTLKVALTGLPNVNKALERYAPMLEALSGAAATVAKEKAQGRSRGDDEDNGDNGNIGSLTSKAIKAIAAKDYDKALKYTLKARKIADIGLTNYNVACVYSLLGENDKAFDYLFQAARKGMTPSGELVRLMKTDSDLDNIRDDPRFKKVMAIAKGNSKNTTVEVDDDGDDDNDAEGEEL
ncbi:MAG: hypothetical protein ABII12_02490 [Planctomycetota bacterium]